MTDTKKYAEQNNYSGVFQAQQAIIAACNGIGQLETVRGCIQNTVDWGFDKNLAAKLYVQIDERKKEFALQSSPVKKS